MSMFVVVTFALRGTYLGELSASTGSRISLVARRRPDAFDIRFEAQAMPADAAREAAGRLADLMELHETHIDGERWTGQGRVEIENIASQTYRAMVEAVMAVEPAWIVMDSGLIQLRLRPSDGDVWALSATVQRFLRDHGLIWDVQQMDLDDAWYADMVEAIRPVVTA